jgi:hypothetical protein
MKAVATKKKSAKRAEPKSRTASRKRRIAAERLIPRVGFTKGRARALWNANRDEKFYNMNDLARCEVVHESFGLLVAVVVDHRPGAELETEQDDRGYVLVGAFFNSWPKIVCVGWLDSRGRFHDPSEDEALWSEEITLCRKAAVNS